jgi:hypothetical protein
MNEQTETRSFTLLDVIATEVTATRSELRGLEAKVAADIRALDAKVTSGFERVERLGHLEARVEGVEAEAQLFRMEFERRVAPLERRRPS